MKKRVYPPDHMFWERVEKTEGGCWQWIGARTGKRIDPRPTLMYHQTIYSPRRWGWIICRGDTHPETALLIACGNEMCVNPEHMCLKRRRRCTRGHLLAGKNLYVSPKGARSCRECVRRRQRTPQARLRQRQRAARISSEKRDRANAARREKTKQKQLIRSVKEVAVWSADLRRWLLFDGRRWIRGGDPEAYEIMAGHLFPKRGRRSLSEIETLRGVIQAMKGKEAGDGREG